MKTRFKKADIQFHSNGWRASCPAVNVKDRSPYLLSQIQARFRCCEATAQKAHQLAWEMHAEAFWENAQQLAEAYLGQYFGSSLKVWSEGRQGGWLVVDGLPEVDSWDAPRVTAWGNFARALRREVDHQTSLDAICESIDANGWARPDALLDDKETEQEERKHWEARDVETVNT